MLLTKAQYLEAIGILFTSGDRELAQVLAAAPKSWRDRVVPNPHTGRKVKVRNLPPKDQDKYRPYNVKKQEPKKEEPKIDPTQFEEETPDHLKAKPEIPKEATKPKEEPSKEISPKAVKEPKASKKEDPKKKVAPKNKIGVKNDPKIEQQIEDCVRSKEMIKNTKKLAFNKLEEKYKTIFENNSSSDKYAMMQDKEREREATEKEFLKAERAYDQKLKKLQRENGEDEDEDEDIDLSIFERQEDPEDVLDTLFKFLEDTGLKD